MSCDEILAVVTARFADTGEAPGLDAAAELPPAVEEHLAACAGCRAEAEELRGLWSGLTLLEAEAPEGELRALRGEVRALNELVTLSLLEAPSASERLQGVSYGSRLDRKSVV